MEQKMGYLLNIHDRRTINVMCTIQDIGLFSLFMCVCARVYLFLFFVSPSIFPVLHISRSGFESNSYVACVYKTVP